jgi:hypothetical protein
MKQWLFHQQRGKCKMWEEICTHPLLQQVEQCGRICSLLVLLLLVVLMVVLGFRMKLLRLQ